MEFATGGEQMYRDAKELIGLSLKEARRPRKVTQEIYEYSKEKGFVHKETKEAQVLIVYVGLNVSILKSLKTEGGA